MGKKVVLFASEVIEDAVLRSEPKWLEWSDYCIKDEQDRDQQLCMLKWTVMTKK